MRPRIIRNSKNSYRILFVLFAIIFINGNHLSAQQKSNDSMRGYIPKNGFVPDKITAVRIAIAVWLPIYGEIIYKEKPYIANLKNGVWIVKGSLPKGSVGGVAMIAIQKKDGKIITVIHSK